MKLRTTATLAAFLSASLPWAAALAQPTPGPDKPVAPQPDETPPGDPPIAADRPIPKVASSPSATPGTMPDRDEGAPIRPVTLTTDAFSFWPIVVIQTQLTPYVGQNASLLAGDIAERPGFRLRRARFGLGASYLRLLQSEIAGDLSSDEGGSLTLNRAWIGLTPAPYFNAFMGIVDVPFSRSALIPSAESALIDRPLAVRAMAPVQQLGALVAGSVADGRFQYALGVLNGFQRTDLFYTGYLQGLGALGNRFDNLAYVARLASSLDAPGLDIPFAHDKKKRFNLGAAYFFSDGGARDIHSVEADFLFQRSGFRVLGEVLYSVTVPESVPTQPTTQTANIESLAVVFEGGYTYRNTLGGHLRAEWIDPNSAVDDATDNWLLTFGVALTPPPVDRFFKAQLEFTHREELHGQALDNDSLTLQTQFVLQ